MDLLASAIRSSSRSWTSEAPSLAAALVRSVNWPASTFSVVRARLKAAIAVCEMRSSSWSTLRSADWTS